ncbi:poly [ADP-ribose] polymerase tankyrase-2-like [Schistocerca gregaria]|uniref:poly [ADP-ribose] polymerase tankyrase-2-like n=1 Tax=Schistocerca gregaria TaxID=7010 RepID=UPI00211F03FD|nr:poly [ADP-ribose] polymerase tankyrase-2-like [Schistocerca gregaria]
MGVTPLHQAVVSRCGECVERLVNESEIELDARDSLLMTPLCLATILDDLRTVEALVSRGSDLEAGDEMDLTPLHHACAYGYLEVVSFLLGNGADPTIAAMIDDTTPFDQASSHGHYEVLEKLFEYRSYTSRGSEKAIALASANGHTRRR